MVGERTSPQKHYIRRWLLSTLCVLLSLAPGSCFQSTSTNNWQLRCSLSSSTVTCNQAFRGTRLHVPVTFDGGAQSADRRKYGRALCMSTQSAESAFARFFGPTAIARVMQAANNVPPVYYFIYLLAAGVGVPVSEDVLIIFVGTWLGSKDITLAHKLASIAWCYAGVVLSDYITYGMGAGFRRGFFNPLRKILFRDLGDEVESSSQGPTSVVVKNAGDDGGSSSRLLERIRRSGRFVGLAERFAVGARGPMSLLCGFTGVPFRSFGGGVAIGAMLTMPIQLVLGHLLRDSPATVAAIGAAFVSYYALGPPVVAGLGVLGLWLDRKRARDDAHDPTELVVKPDSPASTTELGS